MSDEQAQAVVSAEDQAEVSTAAAQEESGAERDENAADSATAEQTDENEQEQTGGRKPEGGFQKRIRKLSERVSAAEQEKEYWRQQALRTQKPEAEQTKAAGGEGHEPQSKDFKTYDEFMDARIEWKAKQLQRQTEVQSEAARTKESWNKQMETGRTKHEDFDEVVGSPSLPISQPMAEVIQASELGADLAYYLGTHVEEAAKLARMSPLTAARELGKIEARLGEKKTAAPGDKPTAPPVSRAPNPPTPVSRPAATARIDLNDPNVPWKDWVKAREAALRKK